MRKQLLLLLLLSLLLNSCDFYSNCEKKSVDSRVEAILNEYNEKESFIMVSDLGRRDTFTLVSKSNDYTPCNKFELGPYQNQIIDYSFKSSIYEDTETGIYASAGTSTYGENKIVFKVYGTHNVVGDLDSLPIRDIRNNGFDQKIKSYLVSNKYLDSFIKRSYWSVEKGLIKFETNKGEVFELTPIAK